MLIKQMILELKRTKSGTQKFLVKSIVREKDSTCYLFEDESFNCRFTLKKVADVYIGNVQLMIHNHAFRVSDNLVSVNPLSFYFDLEIKPKRITAMYLHRDWWTRPQFINSYKDIPERTQTMYMDYGKEFAHYLALAGEKFKTTFSGSEDGKLKVSITSNVAGFNKVSEPMFAYKEGENFYETIYQTTKVATGELGLRTKRDKKYPEIFDSLGWCSWDAFYTTVNDQKLRDKVSEFHNKKIPVKWLLIDDGWLSVLDERLISYKPDCTKFPYEFKNLITDIKANSQIEHVGVWHAIPGYWGGVHQEFNGVSEKCIYATRNDKYLPYPNRDVGKEFYAQWYRYLSNQGISFVKVDGQSAIKNYYEDHVPLCEAARETHLALESAVHEYMSDQIINCMGMAMENIMGRDNSAISRNSDDFVPNDEQGFYEHLLQNAYNAVYHDEFYFCDWDMFWSNHFDAERHAALRAISGGPIYISDKIGETNFEMIKPLIYNNGQILRLNASAKPTIDCMFTDPKDKVLKLFNTGSCGTSTVGVLACFNEKSKNCIVSIAHSDFPGIEADRWILYNVREKESHVLDRKDEVTFNLAEHDFLYFSFFPLEEPVMPLGLIDKWNGFMAIISVDYNQNQCEINLKEGGVFGCYGETIKAIYINGVNKTDALVREKGINHIKVDNNEDEKAIIIRIDY